MQWHATRWSVGTRSVTSSRSRTSSTASSGGPTPAPRRCVRPLPEAGCRRWTCTRPEDTIVAKLELPGIEPDDVEVAVEDATLTVSGTREFESETNEENYHRVERRYGSFTRSIALPQTADVDRVGARFDKGVLTIEVPKSERAKPKKIEIEAVS